MPGIISPDEWDAFWPEWIDSTRCRKSAKFVIRGTVTIMRERMGTQKPFLRFAIEPELLKRLDEFRFRNRLATRASAINLLISWALENDPPPAPKALACPESILLNTFRTFIAPVRRKLTRRHDCRPIPICGTITSATWSECPPGLFRL